MCERMKIKTTRSKHQTDSSTCMGHSSMLNRLHRCMSQRLPHNRRRFSSTPYERRFARQAKRPVRHQTHSLWRVRYPKAPASAPHTRKTPLRQRHARRRISASATPVSPSGNGAVDDGQAADCELVHAHQNTLELPLVVDHDSRARRQEQADVKHAEAVRA